MVDPDLPPWRGLLRVQTELGTRCTGFLVAPGIAITAAHCLYLRNTGNDIRPRDVHVLLRVDLDRFAGHSRVASFSIPPGYSAAREGATAALDRAVLVLDRPLGGPGDAYRIATALPPVGARLMVAGYGQDRMQRPVADPDCRFLGEAGGLIRHDCAATRGDSGAPLLALQDGAWRVIGVAIEADLGRVGGLAACLVPGVAGSSR